MGLVFPAHLCYSYSIDERGDSMAGTIVQFFATRQEILAFADRLRADREMVAAAGHYSTPGEYTLLLPNEPISRIEDSSFLYLKLGTEFTEENSLFIHIQDDERGFRESSAGLKGEGPEFEYWKKQLAKFKRTLHRGAFVGDPRTGVGRYYRNVYYTDGAKAAQDRGTQMLAFAGSTQYHLGDWQP